MPKKVLIVEDEPDIQEIERMVVEDMLGCEAILASTGEEALEIASRHHPDLVVLDLVLPGIDGFTVASRLRAEPALASTRILAISGLTHQEDRERVKAVGCDGLLSKPFDLDQLMKTMEDLLKVHASEAW